MNEASLVAAAKSGEREALDALCQAHVPRLFRAVQRITQNREDAEDAVQDSFLNALRHLKSFDGRSTFCTWLTRIGINSALMILRKKRNSREISVYGSTGDEPTWEVPDSAPNPERRYAERERDRFLRSALQLLSPRIRRALELHTFQDNSVEETALQLGISVSAAKARVFRAKAVLRKSKVLRKINEPTWHGLEVKGGELWYTSRFEYRRADRHRSRCRSNLCARRSTKLTGAGWRCCRCARYRRAWSSGCAIRAAYGFRGFAIARGVGTAELAKKLGAHHYIDSSAADPAAELQALGGAQVILITASGGKTVAATFKGLRPGGVSIAVGVGPEPIEVTGMDLIFATRKVEGVLTGTPAVGDLTLRFSALSGVSAMIETVPLEQAAAAYAKMMAGKARFRMVLVTKNGAGQSAR